MAANSPNSVYPQFMQMKKNQFRHSVSKAMTGTPYKPKSKKQIQSDTPDPDAPDEQVAQQKTIRKMGAAAYKGDIDSLASAYQSYGDGDGGTFGAGGGKGGGGFGKKGE